MTIYKLKNKNGLIAYYTIAVIAIVVILAVCSYFLGSNIQSKGGAEVKTTIVTSVVFYGGMLWLAIKVILGVFMFKKQLKKLNNNDFHILKEIAPSKYKPDAVKSKQTKIQDVYKEKKIGDNYMRITPKELVVVYDKEFKSKEDFYKSLSYTLKEIQEEIRNMENTKN